MKYIKRNLVNAIILAVSLFVCTEAARADVKIKTKTTMSGNTSEQTVYIKGKRQRTEIMNGIMITIIQCDLQRDLQLSPQTKTYIINSYAQADDSTTPNESKTQNPKSAIEKGGIITMTVTNKDTGERKQMFGYTARHIITTIETVSSPDACNKQKSKMEIDGWYIDAAFALNGDNNRPFYNNYNNNGGCQDRFETKQIGAAKTGYPVLVKTTMYGENGEVTMTMLQEAIEISQATLDASLFDVPSDYRQVQNQQEMYTSVSTSGMSATSSTSSSNSGSIMPDLNNSSTSRANTNLQQMAQNQTDIPTNVGTKKEGVIRLGLVAVKADKVGDGMSARDLSAAIQNTLAQYLKSPNVELVQLESRLPSAIDAEAKQKECDFVLYTNVSRKKGGGFGMFGKIGQVVPVAGMGTKTGQVVSTVVHTAATMSANVKSKDEILLEVKLHQPGNSSPLLTKQAKAKAKSDGEDIIAPVIEQVAQAIMDKVGKS